MRKTLIAIASVAAFLAAPAAAQADNETVSITVQTSDLDLTDSSDRVRLDRRIETATSRACRNGGRDLSSLRAEAACRADLADSLARQAEVAIINANEEHLASNDRSTSVRN